MWRFVNVTPTVVVTRYNPGGGIIRPSLPHTTQPGGVLPPATLKLPLVPDTTTGPGLISFSAMFRSPSISRRFRPQK